jgi:hypothetical protein
MSAEVKRYALGEAGHANMTVVHTEHLTPPTLRV